MHIAAWCTYTLVKCIEECQVYVPMYVSVYIHGCVTDLHCFWWLLCHFSLTDKLLTAPINPSSHELPSPNALKYKIILKHKKLGESLQTVKAFDGFGSQDSKLCVSCGDGCTSPTWVVTDTSTSPTWVVMDMSTSPTWVVTDTRPHLGSDRYTSPPG